MRRGNVLISDLSVLPYAGTHYIYNVSCVIFLFLIYTAVTDRYLLHEYSLLVPFYVCGELLVYFSSTVLSDSLSRIGLDDMYFIFNRS